jgi:hypothetical protein
VTLTGAVNAAEAQNPAIYRLTSPGKRGSYTAKNAKAIRLKSAVFNSADDTVTLIPSNPFAVSKPVQLQINGQPPAGLRDGSSRLIDGNHNGTPGGDAVAILSRRGASIEAITPGTPSGQNAGIMAIVDALFEQDALAELTAATRPGRGRVAAAW